ncbi:hypothetical protein LRH25_20270 [Ideonella azotifigens]|uniref:Uncharacterized protein n=1 Tax=Ideonella azotifigens TaxID=513160 RepID=A0ABN1JZJ2_9BURK|nr:hypothetical protein [Ideonella azotifigens]MCD2342666.1 hypothetical protein [Ideonella azotifigens]
MATIPAPTVIRAGTPGKSNPFTILVVANPALEAPWNSNTFVADPIATAAQQVNFDNCVRYIERSLFTGLPSQSELILGDPAISPHIRLLSLFATGLPVDDAHAFAAQDGVSNLLVARRNPIRDFLISQNIIADVVYAISASASHQRASAWFTTDDDGGPGVAFTLDGATLSHRHFYLTPGTVAMHHTATSLTAPHEFQHAVSSYTNGKLVDLYVDSPPDLNNKNGPPVQPKFCTVNATGFLSDLTRGPLGYPPTWRSFHCELHDPSNPAIMDNYWLAPAGVPEVCQNDRVTRTFVRDRLLAKIAR